MSHAHPNTPGGETTARPQPKAPPGPGPRIALRNWRISTRLVSLLTLPVVAATTLGALRIDDSMNKLQQLDNMKLLTEMTKQATELASALQEERDHSAGPLAAGDPKNDDVVYSRQQTDQARQAFEKATKDIESTNANKLVGVDSSLVNILKQLEKIKSIRKAAYARDDYIALTVYQYNQLITSLLSLSQDMAQATSNSDMIRSTRALAAFSSAKEYASMQRAIISAALAHKPKPKLVSSDRLYGQSAEEAEESAISQFMQIYAGKSSSDELLRALEAGGDPNITLADTFADRVLKTDGQINDQKLSYKDWYDRDTTKIDEMSRIEATLLSEMEEKAKELRFEAQRDAVINGVLILLVLGVSLIGAFVVARSMVRSLRRLQDTAQEVSQKRLPELVKQLSESDPQDVDTSVESVGVHSRDEIGRVAAAFDDVHREAVRLAAEQALLRGNVNAMFTNLSRRSQGLIQRQLSLISELESREADPDQLSSLFKLDHLATRMRRNGENLLVLAGEEPGRRWTRPVPLVDVLRAAASEVEQYERIELNSVPATEVAGRVVNDLVHLLAELLENATSFSSPQTKVKVTGHALPDGRVLVEIHDTGIGLSPEDLAAINERLASPPTVDVSVSRRMGLFVVGRLSLRHGIRIQLRPSDSGGTTALVMLPVDVAQGGAKAARPGSSGAGSPTGGGDTARSGPSSRLAGMTPRGQVPGGGTRAALPGRDSGFAGGGHGGQQGRPGGGQSHPRDSGGAPAGVGSGRAGVPGQGGWLGGGSDSARDNASHAPTGRRGGPEGHTWAGKDGPAGPEAADTALGESPATGGPAVAPPAGAPAQPAHGHGGQGGRPQLTPRGPAAELPGGAGDHGSPAGSQQPGTAWGARRAAGSGDWADGARDAAEASRGHRKADSTRQFERPDYTAAQSGGNTDRFAPQPSEPDALPPASTPGDGRTPLFDTLESDWFRAGSRRDQTAEPSAPAAPPPMPPMPPSVPRQPEAPLPRRAPHAERDSAGDWRASPNDELVRRAEQVRKPAAGGLTTSGLPRRVPRANLVAGTAAQSQPRQPGPQVSRAPTDVRGRLTNLRRGIQQGRQAGTSSGNNSRGTHNQGYGPTYRQER
jgi:signal transduction histidine kinase